MYFQQSQSQVQDYSYSRRLKLLVLTYTILTLANQNIQIYGKTPLTGQIQLVSIWTLHCHL